jgi:hypothetical protein
MSFFICLRRIQLNPVIMASFLYSAGIHVHPPTDPLNLTAQDAYDNICVTSSTVSTIRDLRDQIDLLTEQMNFILLHVADSLEDVEDEVSDAEWADWRGTTAEALRRWRQDITHRNKQKAHRLRGWLMHRPPSPPTPRPPHHPTPPPLIIPRRTAPLPPKPRAEQKEE